MVQYINQVPLNQLQLDLMAKAQQLGFNVKWWGRPDEAVTRLYVNNNIQIGDSEAVVKIYFKFEDPAQLLNPELKVSTAEQLDKNTYKQLMQSVRNWLLPLTKELGVADFVPRSKPSPDVIIPTIPRQGHTVGEIDEPKFSKPAQNPFPSGDDIPF